MRRTLLGASTAAAIAQAIKSAGLAGTVLFVEEVADALPPLPDLRIAEHAWARTGKQKAQWKRERRGRR